MATEKRLIDANALDDILKDFESRHQKSCFVLSAKAIANTRQIVYAMKTVDAVEVVRCEHCINSICEGWICGGPSFTMPSHPTYPDAFCSYGERKTNEID
jgi:hypothetical protein